MASSAAAASSPVGVKRPRSNSSDEDIDIDEQCAGAGGNRTSGGSSSSSVALSSRRRSSAAKSAMVSIKNLLRVAQEQGRGGGSPKWSGTAKPEAEADTDTDTDTDTDADADARALSWADDDIENAAMQLPPILPQIAISNPQLYAARMKMIADAEHRREVEEERRLARLQKQQEQEQQEQQEQQPKRKRPKKDPNHPKKPRSAYSYFVVEFHSNIKGGEEKKEDTDDGQQQQQQQQQANNFVDAGKKMGQQWKNISDADRKKFDDMAAKDKLRYTAEMEVYAKKQKEEAAAKASTTSSGSKTDQQKPQSPKLPPQQQAQKAKAPRTPTANRLVNGNRSADGGVLGGIGSSSSSKTPAKLLQSGPAPDIGEGWTAKTFQRQTGSSAGTTDSYWYSPALEKKFRSKAEIKRFKEALAEVYAFAGGEGKVDAAHAERLAWRAFKSKKKAA